MIRVTVAWSPAARQVREQAVELADGATLGQALAAAGVDVSTIDPMGLAVWGRRQSLGAVLRDGDRAEILRPLAVDPKVARRERFSQQGSRKAGLFTQRRSGSKAGY